VKTVEAGNGFADLQKLKAMLGGGARAGGQPADFTDDVWEFGASDGEIFAAIAEGRRPTWRATAIASSRRRSGIW
jgi:hypothetical protein